MSARADLPTVRKVVLITTIVLLAACSGSSQSPATNLDTTSVRYLALGDSFTIGTGATDESHNYPSILAKRLTQATGQKVNLTNPAVNGYTTVNLIGRELKYVNRVQPDLVTVLIGVNDIVQGRSEADYRVSLAFIYDAVANLTLHQGRVVCVSIPDWADAPAARSFGTPDELRRRTQAFNAIAKEESAARGFTWVDITKASLSGAGTPGWMASDNLHPGDPQYAAWADVIWNSAKDSWTTIRT